MLSQNTHSVTIAGNFTSLPVVETLGELVAARVGDRHIFAIESWPN